MQTIELPLTHTELLSTTTYESQFSMAYGNFEIPLEWINRSVKIHAIRCHVSDPLIYFTLTNFFCKNHVSICVYPYIFHQLGYTNLLHFNGPITILAQSQHFISINTPRKKTIYGEDLIQILTSTRCELIWSYDDECPVPASLISIHMSECGEIRFGQYKLLVYSNEPLDIDELKIYILFNHVDYYTIENHPFTEMKIQHISPHCIIVHYIWDVFDNKNYMLFFPKPENGWIKYMTITS